MSAPLATANLQEAAKLLHCHEQTVRKLAKSGKLAGSKIGRAWVFLVDDIANLIRSGQNAPCLPVPGKDESWHFTKEVTRSGSVSQRQTEKELDDLLAQRTGKKRKSSLTS